MTSAQRKAIHDVLMRGVRVQPDDPLYTILSAITWDDVNTLEPLIDGWLAQRPLRHLANRKTVEEILKLEQPE
jgi:hypothetical protein